MGTNEFTTRQESTQKFWGSNLSVCDHREQRCAQKHSRLVCSALSKPLICPFVLDHCNGTEETGAERITSLGNPGSHEDSFVRRFMPLRRAVSRTQAFQLQRCVPPHEQFPIRAVLCRTLAQLTFPEPSVSQAMLPQYKRRVWLPAPKGSVLTWLISIPAPEAQASLPACA